MVPYYPRALNQMYAYSQGYFWISCPICGKGFGGHEWSETLMESENRGIAVCPLCVDIAHQSNVSHGWDSLREIGVKL
jgi:hypothetical protein